VVRAIAAMPMPVVCGIGHESDLTLADLVADLRAPTPTAAAELAAPRRQDCLDTLETLAGSLRRRVRSGLDSRAQDLDRHALRLARPAGSLRRSGQRLDVLAHRLAAAARSHGEHHRWQATRLDERLAHAATGLCAAHRQRLATLAQRLHALDPTQVLARGYAWLADEHDQAVVSVAKLTVGARLTAVLADGNAQVAVTQVHPAPPSRANTAAR
jgi:exodeoxyribonuclease VII large subunit